MAKSTDIKKANALCEYTPEQKIELGKCARSPLYFIENYVKVINPTKGSVAFKLYDYQKELVKALHENKKLIALCSRQMGKTITIAIFLLWVAAFQDDKLILIASKDDTLAIEIMDRIRYAYELLPHWLKPGCRYYNRHEIRFDNGSILKCQATTEKTGRGFSASIVYLDELAFASPKIQEKLWASIFPTISTGGSMIISSTPNGDTDIFAQKWHEAENGQNSFYAFKALWHMHPDRDENWRAAQEADLGEVMYRQEVECEFLSSDILLISSMVLRKLLSVEPIFSLEEFRFWKNPQEIGGSKKTYLMSIDLCSGVEKDFTVIYILDTDNYELIGEYRSNINSQGNIYKKIKWILGYLTRRTIRGSANVIWSFERNGIGEGLISLIMNDESKDGVYLDNTELYSEGANGRLGVFTSGQAKTIACSQLKTMIEKINNPIKLNSNILIKELKTYVSSGGTYKGKPGCTDDCVSSLLVMTRLLAYFGSWTPEAKNLIYDYENIENDFGDDTNKYNMNNDFDEPLPFIV